MILYVFLLLSLVVLILSCYFVIEYAGKKIIIVFPIILFLLSIFLVGNSGLLLRIIENNIYSTDLLSISYILLLFSLFLLVLFLILYILNKKRIEQFSIVIVFGLSLFSFILGYSFQKENIKNIQIQSVCRRLEFDDDGNKLEEDISYVELVNKGKYDVYFNSIYLSDGTAWNDYKFDDICIKKDDSYRLEMLVTEGIELSKTQETSIYLYESENNLLDSIVVPGLPKNNKYDVKKDEIKSIIKEKVYVEEPVFSKAGGYYDNSFYLTLDTKQDLTIYYTLDSSDPDETSFVYKEPIYVYDRSEEENIYRNIPDVVEVGAEFITPEKVDKCFVVRAAAKDVNGNWSEIKTSSYIINKPEYKDKKILSIVTDPDNLFDPDVGIYVVGRAATEWFENGDEEAEFPGYNFRRRGKESERKANLEIFNELNQFVGIRLIGNTGRNPQLKRLSIFSRDEYSGSDYFDYDIFGKKVHSLVLRGGVDNALANMLVKDRNVATSDVELVSVFIDGEFWYDTFMLEKQNEAFFSNTYNVNKDNVELSTEGDVPSEDTYGTWIAYFYPLDYLANHDVNLKETYDAVNEFIDLQSYIDYECINIYLANHDATEYINNKMWHTVVDEGSEYGDTRWRWVIYDFDLLKHLMVKKYQLNRSAEIDSFIAIKKDGDFDDAWMLQPLFSYMMYSDIFRKNFVNTFMDLINTDFEVNRVSSVLEKIGEDISYDNYFFRDRAEYITGYMEEHFELKGQQVNVSLSTNNYKKGSIILNTINPDLTNKWTGKYYTDYPITITANPIEGNNFKYFIINGDRYNEESLSIDVPIEGLDIKAIYE